MVHKRLKEYDDHPFHGVSLAILPESNGEWIVVTPARVPKWEPDMRARIRKIEKQLRQEHTLAAEGGSGPKFQRSLILNGRNIPETFAVHPPPVIKQEGDMTALAARFVPNASAEGVTEFETFVSLALFCGTGLLLSLSVLLLDKYNNGDWFGPLLRGIVVLAIVTFALSTMMRGQPHFSLRPTQGLPAVNVP